MQRTAGAAVLAALILFAAPRAVHAQSILTVHDAVERALRSPAAQLEDAHVEEARGSVRQAGLGPNPRLFLQSEDLRPWDRNFSFQTQTEDYGYLGQTFELDGKRRKRVAVARARLAQAQANHDLRLRQLAIGVVSAYWVAAAAQQSVALTQQQIAAADELVRYSQDRVDAGAMRGVDLLRARVERDRLMIGLQGALQEAARARFDLLRSAGMASTEVRLSDPADAVMVPPPMDVETVLQQRPEVLASRDAVAAAEADVRLQQANGVPDADLLAGYKRNSSDNTAYLALQVPLPFRNRNQGEVQRARASLLAARASLAIVETQVRLELQQAQLNFDAQQRIVHDVLPQMRADAKQNLDLLREAYRIGGVDLLRLLDAQRVEYEVEADALRALTQLQQAAAQLQIAEGVMP